MTFKMVTLTRAQASDPIANTIPVITGLPTLTVSNDPPIEGDVITLNAAPVSGTPTPTRTWTLLRGGVSSGLVTSPYTVVSADVGERLSFIQAETNSEGTDTATSSETLAVVNSNTAPSAITDLSVSSVTDTTATLTFTAPTDGGSPITDYVYEYQDVTNGGSFTTFTDSISNTVGAIITGLTPNTEYNFRATPSNVVGSGGVSNTANGTTNSAVLRSIVMHNTLPDDVNSEAGADRYVVKSRVFIAQDASDLVLAFDNYYLSNTQTNTGNSITPLKVAIQNAAGTVTVPVNFSGSRTVVIADGASKFLTDSIDPSAFSLSQFTTGEEYIIKAEYSFNAGENMPMKPHVVTSGTQSAFFNSANTTASDVDAFGDFTFTGTAQANRTLAYVPIVLGTPVNSNVKVLLAVADSMYNRLSDGGDNDPLGRNMFQRAMTTVAGTVANPIPNFNFSKIGIRISGFTGSNDKWQDYLENATQGVIQLGTNSAGSTDVTQMNTEITEIANTMRAGGLSYIYRPSLLGYTTSTDSWVTTANQSEYVGDGAGEWNAGGEIEQHNDWARTTAIDTGVIDEYIPVDCALLDEDRNWIDIGGASVVADGVHLNTVGSEEAAVVLRDAFRGVVTNIKLPSISGTSGLGNQLTIDLGCWTGNPNLTSQIQRDGVDIAGATGLTYTQVAADDGADLTVVVTDGTTTVTSMAFSVSFGGATVSTILFISGVVQAGQILTAFDDGSLTGTGQWKLNNVDIAGQTAMTLTVPTVAVNDVIHFEKDGETSNSITNHGIVARTINNAANTGTKQFTGLNLTQLDDTSGNNRHIVPSTGNGNTFTTKKAPNGVVDVITSAQATGQTLTYVDTANRTGSRTIILGFKANAVPSGFKRYWSSGGVVEQNVWNAEGQLMTISAGTSAFSTDRTTTVVSDDQPNLWVVVFDDVAGTAKIWKNGGTPNTISNSGNNPGNEGFTIFGGDPSGGDNLGSADFFIHKEFDVELTPAQMNLICPDIPPQFGITTWTTAVA